MIKSATRHPCPFYKLNHLGFAPLAQGGRRPGVEAWGGWLRLSAGVLVPPTTTPGRHRGSFCGGQGVALSAPCFSANKQCELEGGGGSNPAFHFISVPSRLITL